MPPRRARGTECGHLAGYEMFDGLVTVIGGSGFVGRHVVRALARKGYRVRVAVRRPDLAGHLQPLGGVGQIHSVQANLRYPKSLAAACEGADAVISMAGLLYESGAQTFDAVHVMGARAAAEAAKEAGASRFVQISAIGADPESGANYARTKAAGEQAVLEAFPGATILRPSIVFGPEDDFFNRFAAMARISPALPLVGGGGTRFQPVFVGDVAAAVCAVLENDAARGQTYELGGPEVLTFREVLEFILKATDRRRLLVPLPFGVAKVQATFLQLLPKPLLTIDQVTMLQDDNVVGADAESDGRTLQGLGITPQAVEAIVPEYLERFRRAGQFTKPHSAENNGS